MPWRQARSRPTVGSLTPFVGAASTVCGVYPRFDLLDASARAARTVAFGIVASLAATFILMLIAAVASVLSELLRESEDDGDTVP